VFEGKKIYADHPSADEDQNRPERSVRDVLGHFENIAIEEADDGRALLMGDVTILPDKPFEWARALMRHSIEYAKKYPDKDFVGLSINAMGDAQESSIQSVLESAPESVKAKLIQARDMGIENVRLVSVITEAVSCDLVTEAGAGGKITNILESNKEQEEMKKKIKEADVEQKPEGEKPEAKHDDAAQDMELIKKMMDQYMGKEGYDESEMQQAMEAMNCAVKGGEEKEEAARMACSAMKMAKHMNAMKQAEESAGEGEEKKEESDEMSKESQKEAEEAKKESSTPATDAEVTKLRGENAALKEKLAKIVIAEHLEKTLKESGLTMSVTKKFREMVEGAKSKKEIDDKFKLFMEGYKATGGEAGSSFDFMIQPEKTGAVEGAKFALEDCFN
jgi:hypothetical protein